MPSFATSSGWRPSISQAARDERDRALFYDAIEAHHLVDEVLPDLELLAGNEDAFAAKLRAVERLVVDRADNEEREMFPRAREITGADGLNRMADRLTREKSGSSRAGRGR